MVCGENVENHRIHFHSIMIVSSSLHHLTFSGRLFDLADILHHEFFEATFITAGIILLITSRINQK
jgi:hypothetical protein